MLLISLVVGLVVFALIWFISPRSKSHSPQQTLPDESEQPLKKKRKAGATQAVRKAPSAPPKKASGRTPRKDSEITNQFLIRHLRGHQNDVTGCAWSASGSFIASCSRDESIRIWDLTSITPTNPSPSSIRAQVKGSRFSCLSLSQDSRYAVASTEYDRHLYIYSIDTKMNEEGVNKFHLTFLREFATLCKDDITHICASRSLSYICVMMSGVQDTSIHVYNGNSNGELMYSFKTQQLINHCMSMSIDDRFLAIGTKMSDTRLWLLHDGKSILMKASVAMSLKGVHKTGVTALAFGGGPTHTSFIITATGDNKWYVWDINVRYQMNEDPKLKASYSTPFSKIEKIAVVSVSQYKDSSESETSKANMAMIADNQLHFYHIQTGKLIASVPEPHSGRVMSMEFSPDGSSLVTCGGSDRSVSMWRVPSLPELQ